MTFGPANTQGPFIPTNQYFPEDPQKLKETLSITYSDMARRLNIKEIAIYDLTEIPTGEQWFNPLNVQIKRDGFRQVYYITTPIAPGTTYIQAHGITGFATTLTFTHIYGTATINAASFEFKPMPYVNNSLETITLEVDNFNFEIINGLTVTGFTIISAIVVLEYLKN